MNNEIIELNESELETIVAGSAIADRAGVGAAAGTAFGGLVAANLWGLGLVTGATIITGGGFLAALAIGAAIGGTVGLLSARS